MVVKKKVKSVSGTENHEDLKEALNALEPERKISETARVIEKLLPLFRYSLERGVPCEQVFEVLKKHGVLTIKYTTFVST